MRKIFTLIGLMICLTIMAIDAPVPSSPDNHLTSCYTKQTLKWSKVTGAGYYHVQLDTTNQFNSPMLRDIPNISANTSSTQSYVVMDLLFNTHYYWRVRTISSASTEVTSDWSQVWDFTTLRRVTPYSPNDSSVTENYYPEQTIKWKTSFGCHRYVIQLDTTEDFSSPAAWRVNCSSSATSSDTYTSMSVSNLYLGRMIYWRVKGFNQNDSSQWSLAYRFHTLKHCTLSSPSDSLTNAYTQQTLTWSYFKGFNKAIIQLDTVRTFNSPVLRVITTSTSSSNNSYGVSDLYFGKTYYWRVRLAHSKDTTNWSRIRMFTTYNHCNLSTPTDGATGRYTSGSLSWEWSKGINKYQVQLDTARTFNSPVLKSVVTSASSSSSANYSYSYLYFGKTYYWRVRECHQNDTSKWSAIRSFTTYRRGVLAATPADSATGVSTSPQVYFEYSTGISKYQMQLDTVPTFDSPLCQTHMESASGSSSAYHTYNDLLFGTRYYRRMRECHQNDTSAWSAIWCFTTYYRGSLDTPTDGATEVSVKPKLYFTYRSWVDYYQLQLDTTPSFNSPQFRTRIETASGSSSAYWSVADTLLYGTTYYWRERDIHSRDTSGWSTMRSFTTKLMSPAPTLLSPADQTIIYTDTLPTQFRWKSYKNATAYTWQISENQNFNTLSKDTCMQDTAISVILPLDKQYYWRVQASTPRGKTTWSTVRSVAIRDSLALYTLTRPELTSPSDELTGAYTRQYFGWSQVTGANRYVIELDTTLQFNSPELWRDTVTTYTNNLRYDLRFGTQYYWRVMALASNNVDRSRWSPISTFTTGYRPTLYSINDSSETGNYYPKQTLKWKHHLGCTAYVVEVDTSELFNSPVKLRYNTSTYHSNTDTYKEMEVSNLYLGKMNYWRVRAYNEKDSSNWSQVWRFHTLNWARGINPIDLETAYTNQSFTWTRLNGLPKVVIELDTTAQFSSPALRTITSWAYSDDDAHEEVTNLYFGKMHYWRIRYYHDRDTTAWSPVYSFKTYNWCNLSFPEDSATNRLTSGKLTWEWDRGVYTYQVQLDTTPSFNSPELINRKESASDNFTTYYQYSNLFFGTHYYWRVRQCHAKDTSKWSKTRVFTTYYRGVQGTSPADGATDLMIRPTLYIDYTTGISNYLVDMDTARTFNSDLYRCVPVTASSSSYAYWTVDRDLLYGTTYYWRVADINARDTSDWARPHQFTTTTILDQPQPVAPADLTTANNSTPVTFIWNTVDGATSYCIQVSDSADFSHILHAESTTGQTAQMVLLSENTTLYWRVQAINSLGRSLWSDAWRVVTVSGPSTDLDRLMDNEHAVKFIRDGQVMIMVRGKIYNLVGEIVE